MTETSPCHPDESLRTRHYRVSLFALQALLQSLVPTLTRRGRPWRIKSRSGDGEPVLTVHIEHGVGPFLFDIFVRAREDGPALRLDATAQPRRAVNDLGESAKSLRTLLNAIDYRLGRRKLEPELGH